MTDDLRRITVDEVRAAVEKTGLELVPDLTCVRDGFGKTCGGCVIFVVAVAEGFTPMDSEYVFLREPINYLGLDSDYADGLATAFDSKSQDRSELSYTLGHADGLAIRNALLPTAVTA